MATEPDDFINVSYDSVLTQLADGAPLPTTLEEVLPAGSIRLGDTTEDGEAFSRSVTVESRKAHQKGRNVRDFVTDAPKTLALTFLEGNDAVLALYHGSPVVDGKIISGDKVIKANFVYDTFDDEKGRAVRYVFRATATPNGDIVYVGNELTTYPVLLTAIGDVTILLPTEAPVAP